MPANNHRRRAVLLPLGLLVLSMAVFSWGLQYKLSLYHAKDSITHATPVAKLLSQKERPVAAQAVQLSESPAWPLILIMVLAFVPCVAARTYLQTLFCEPGLSRLPLYSRSMYVRPPPARFSLL